LKIEQNINNFPVTELAIFTNWYHLEFPEVSCSDFNNGKIRLQPSLMLVAGICSFVSFYTMYQVKEHPDAVQISMLRQRDTIFILLVRLVDTFIRGISGWFNPEIWLAGILPVSLVAVLIVALMQIKKQ
ncbi:MAG: hypothetical protein HYV28_13390, partial [Ignavibacteriales bacterium]|nr:hypothetical protein [Ignavibacteriales bacterium]